MKIMMQVVEVDALPGKDVGVFGGAEVFIHACTGGIWWTCSSAVTGYPNISVTAE